MAAKITHIDLEGNIGDVSHVIFEALPIPTADLKIYSGTKAQVESAWNDLDLVGDWKPEMDNESRESKLHSGTLESTGQRAMCLPDGNCGGLFRVVIGGDLVMAAKILDGASKFKSVGIAKIGTDDA